MKFLTSWVGEFVDLGRVENLKDLLARGGIETVGIEKVDGDELYEVEIYANRPDLLSHFGIAREIAVLAGLGLKKREFARHEGEEKFPIRIASDRCDRYCGLVMRDVAVKSSPEWMQKRLRAMGLAPISNVVDATNYLLFEMNHPLHAFDLDRLSGGVNVRMARGGESIALLDGTTKKLTDDDLVIADESRAIALAGVMGGSESAVAPTTRNLLLEAAWFAPASVRRTAKRHAAATDSSYRFERGSDPMILPSALARLAELIVETAGGRIDGGIIDVVRAERAPKPVRFRRESIKRVLGHEVEHAAMILESLGANVTGEMVTPPTWRPDLTREIDLVEEVVRISGYEGLGSSLPLLPEPTLDFSTLVDDARAFREFRELVGRILSQHGLDRSVTFSFAPPAEGEVVISNPINEEESVMRATLVPSLLRLGQLRRDRASATSVRVYEIEKVFSAGPSETYAAAIYISGEAEPRRYDGRAADMTTLDHAIGVLRELARQTRVTVTLADDLAPGEFHGKCFEDSAAILVNGRECGRIGSVKDGFAFELDLVKAFAEAPRTAPAYRALPKFPGSSKDMAFWVPAEVPVGSLLEAARAAGVTILERVEIFDIFSKKGDARKSVALRAGFRASDRTLTDEEISGAFHTIIGEIVKNCGAVLRDGTN